MSLQNISKPHINIDPVGGGRGFFLSDSPVRQIVSGSANLFMGGFHKTTGQAMGPFQFIAGLDEGDLLFPVDVSVAVGNVSYRLLAVPDTDTEIRQSQTPWIRLIREDEGILDRFERFIQHLLTPFTLGMPPAKTQLITRSDLRKSPSFQFEKGVSFRPDRGVLWVEQKDGFCFLNGDQEQMLLAPGSTFPLSDRMWLECRDPVSIACRTTAQMVDAPDAGGVMASIYRQYLRALLMAAAFRKHRRLKRQEELITYEQNTIKDVGQQLRRLVLDRRSVPDTAKTTASPVLLHRVIQRIAQVSGMTVTLPGPGAHMDPVHSISHATRALESCNLYYRTVRLDDGWWRQEGMPAIAFRLEDQKPVALFFERGRWRCFDPVDGREAGVTQSVARKLEPHALSVYIPLPGRVSLKEMLSVALRGLRTDFKAVFLIGMMGGIIALAPAWLMSTIFNTVIPAADMFGLFQAGVILSSAAVSGAFLVLSRSILMLRIKTRSSFQLQAAVWGRLFNLPSRFFSRYTAGDLANRVMGVDAIREHLADNVTIGCMTLLFAVPNLALMLYFSGSMTIVGLMAILIFISLMCWVGYRNYRNQQQQYRYEGDLAGIGLQVLTGIAKIRMAISENRAFIRWAGVLGEKIRWESRSIDNMNVMAVLNALFPPLMTGIFFLIIGSRWRGTTLNVGEYLAFTAAFSSLLVAFTGFAGVLPALLTTGALYKRLKPILEAAPEIVETKEPAGEIDGNVEIRNVTFRYGQDLADASRDNGRGSPVLENVSITARSGEFIAIVGPSGAGKSTIARLLLGFETPETGGIFYGGIDLSSVNLRDLRKQLGVVLQGGGLINGSIYENIAGASGMSLDAAWEAARSAGLDKDIEAMPMGMYTIVYNGAVSGGQQQRILIARALARNPKLIIFDEATSALDNEIQAHVSDSLERLNATRIVIAHRLSTIINADRIYVLEAGKVVQSGTFAELTQQSGLFQQLAKRQMV